jgi:hypothetical protein
MSQIDKRAYAEMYGPTTGDRVRLGDTELVIEVENDHTVYGDEVKFGGGKVIRDGMGQSQRTAGEVADTVVTNALILDYRGVFKADIGIKDGRIAGIGKAGNPDVQPGVDIVLGPGTEVIAAEGQIVTAGGIDAHIHFVCPQQIEEALMSGVTTMLGGGTGPATGTNATTCTPGPWNIHRMLQAAEAFPMNLGFMGKGNASLPDALHEQVEAGAMGLKLHEDWGTTPAAIATTGSYTRPRWRPSTVTCTSDGIGYEPPCVVRWSRSAPDRERHIRGIEARRHRFLVRVAHRARRERVILGNDALAATRRHHGGVEGSCNVDQGVSGVLVTHPRARDNDGGGGASRGRH